MRSLKSISLCSLLGPINLDTSNYKFAGYGINAVRTPLKTLSNISLSITLSKSEPLLLSTC